MTTCTNESDNSDDEVYEDRRHDYDQVVPSSREAIIMNARKASKAILEKWERVA